MRRILVNGYRRQDGTVVRSHEKTISDANPKLIKEAKEINLLGLLKEGSKPATPQLSSFDIVKKFEDVGEESRKASEKIERMLSVAATASVSTFLGGGIGVIAAAAATSIIAALPMLGLVSLVTAGPPLAVSAVKKWKKRKIRDELKNFLKNPVTENEIQEKVEKNPTDWEPSPAFFLNQDKKLHATSYRQSEDSGDGDEPIIVAEVELRSNGTGSMTVPVEFYHGGKIFRETFSATTEFYPEVDLSKRIIEGRFEGQNMNLQKANFSQTTFDGGVIFRDSDMRNVDFSGAKFELGSDMTLSDFRGANFEGADLRQVELRGANLEGANISRTKLPHDLRGIQFDDDQKKLVTSDLHNHIYEKFPFEDTIKQLGISEKQFEFLVLSNVITVRDNETSQIVTENFDPTKHHVDMWEIERLKRVEEKDPSFLKSSDKDG